jgi:hypothetical protein
LNEQVAVVVAQVQSVVQHLQIMVVMAEQDQHLLFQVHQ